MQKPRIRQDNVLAEEVQGECVVYDSSRKKAHHLNSTLSWVWKHCDGTHTIEDLTTAMQRDLGGEDAFGVVVTGLKQLADANLLEPKSFDSNFFVPEPVVSRRSVIAGATIVAPVISSILAPTPAAAKSKPDKIKPDKIKKGK
jgi:coenzyme PQQ synthesis protein D (PqqD)